MRGALVTIAWLALLCGCHNGEHTRDRLVVWHAYRGEEQVALEALLAQARPMFPHVDLEALSVPFDAYASKLESAIPHGHGPDLFLDAHERLARYIARDLVVPLDAEVTPGDYDPVSIEALQRDGHLYAFPLAVKCLALYVNNDLVPVPPRTLQAIEALRGQLPRGVYPLAYYAQNAYFHAPFAHAFGVGMLDDATGRYRFEGPAAARSIERVRGLVRNGIVPEEADGSLVSQLFAQGRAATAISGPWLAGEIDGRVHYTVVPLPTVDGGEMVPFATVEGAFVSQRSAHVRDAVRLARFLASPAAARVRAHTGRQVVATRAAWNDPLLAHDVFLTTFREAAAHARAMPTHPNMRAAFEVANAALQRTFRGEVPVDVALVQSRHRFDDATRPPPRRRNPTLALLALGLAAMALCTAALRRVRDPQFRRALRRSIPAYRYVAHAALALALLVVVPLVVGAITSLFAGREGNFFYVGMANYVDILTARGGSLVASGSFYLVLAVTLLWTVCNIVLHVGIGVSLALLLSRPTLRFKGLYRVLLIVPWAVPSYVTALAWKGMFHRQLGAINAVITALGGTPVAWFSRFATAFAANVATNVWLGFPFMMVVTMGALTAIPRDLYEAAAVDGASSWQQFTRITVPLLRPSLAPAIAMGAVWTFNMFNVIFLVSGGEPDGQTDILITEAYRWAFTRQAQYGYAAAYAVLIFGILFVGTRALDRVVARAQRRAVGA